MIATIQKDIEKESNLLKMPREFLVGGKETWKINENGLGVAYRAKLVRLWRIHPLKWYDGTRWGNNREVILN